MKNLIKVMVLVVIFMSSNCVLANSFVPVFDNNGASYSIKTSSLEFEKQDSGKFQLKVMLQKRVNKATSVKCFSFSFNKSVLNKILANKGYAKRYCFPAFNDSIALYQELLRYCKANDLFPSDF